MANISVSNGQSFSVTGDLIVTDNNTVSGSGYYSPGIAVSTGPSALFYPQHEAWSAKEVEPDILECLYCSTPYERRDASGKLTRTCEECGAPLPKKVKKRKEQGKVRYELADEKDLKRTPGFLERILGTLGA